MRQFKDMHIIGIDHGYGNLKTVNGIFSANVLPFDQEPIHAQDLLVYGGKYYVIGSGHREFTPDKVSNSDHYILTLAGIGQELWAHRMTNARVYIAAGLPLTWVESQRESFRAYLLQNSYVDFTWRGIAYHVEIVGASVYAQGFSAIVPMLRQFKGVNMLCDIGNGTMNIMTIQDRRAVMDQCFTEKYGAFQCMLRAREALTQRFGRTVPDAVIDEVLRNGDADIGRDYVDTIREVAAGYAADIMRKLREHEYDPQTMRLWIVGGGGCLLRHFGAYARDRVNFIDNIHANAEGYELLAERRLKREGAAG